MDTATMMSSISFYLEASILKFRPDPCADFDPEVVVKSANA